MLCELSYEVLHCAVNLSVSLWKFHKGSRDAAASCLAQVNRRKKGSHFPCKYKKKKHHLSAASATFQWIVQVQVLPCALVLENPSTPPPPNLTFSEMILTEVSLSPGESCHCAPFVSAMF